MKKKTAKEVKRQIFLVCASKSQNFAQIQKKNCAVALIKTLDLDLFFVSPLQVSNKAFTDIPSKVPSDDITKPSNHHHDHSK